MSTRLEPQFWKWGTHPEHQSSWLFSVFSLTLKFTVSPLAGLSLSLPALNCSSTTPRWWRALCSSTWTRVRKAGWTGRLPRWAWGPGSAGGIPPCRGTGVPDSAWRTDCKGSLRTPPLHRPQQRRQLSSAGLWIVSMTSAMHHSDFNKTLLSKSVIPVGCGSPASFDKEKPGLRCIYWGCSICWVYIKMLRLKRQTRQMSVIPVTHIWLIKKKYVFGTNFMPLSFMPIIFS